MTENYHLEEILKKPQFDALSMERKEMLLSLSEKLRGKSGMESVGVITEFMKRMPKGEELTRGEQDMMTEAFLVSLPDPDRARFQSLLNMFKGMQKAR